MSFQYFVGLPSEPPFRTSGVVFEGGELRTSGMVFRGEIRTSGEGVKEEEEEED